MSGDGGPLSMPFTRERTFGADRSHLVQDLLAHAHEAPAVCAALMRRAANLIAAERIVALDAEQVEQAFKATVAAQVLGDMLNFVRLTQLLNEQLADAHASAGAPAPAEQSAAA